MPHQLKLRLQAALMSGTLLLAQIAAADSGDTAVQLPDMGESINRFMTANEEQQLGAAFMRNVRRTLTVMDDPQINRYIQSLGQRLATYSTQPQQKFHFFVIDDPAINAFAGPGGYIGINSGLILAARYEDELAAVIAHELAHVTQHHLARAYENTSEMSLPMTAAIIAAIILGNQPGLGQLSEATLVGATAGSLQHQINFTRSNEQEADRIGSQTLARAGYASDAMQRFFTRLLQNNQYQEDAALEFLRTHPLTINRIAGSSNLPLASSTPSNDGGNNSNPSYFSLIQHRIRVLVSNDQMRLDAYYEHLESDNDATRYGKALAAVYNHRYQEAGESLADLTKRSPDNLNFALAAIENEVINGTPERALALINAKLHLYPDDPPLTVFYVQALLRNAEYAQARNVLRQYMHKVSAGPQLYALLAEVEGKYGDVSATHQALAEYYFLNGDSEGALRQIDLALKQGQSLADNDRARLESRRREIKQIIDSEPQH